MTYLTDPEEPSRVKGHDPVPTECSHEKTVLTILSLNTETNAPERSPCEHTITGGTFVAANTPASNGNPSGMSKT